MILFVLSGKPCVPSAFSGSAAVSENPYTLLDGMEVDTAVMENQLKGPSKPKGVSIA